MAFIRGTLTEVHGEFYKSATYSRLELEIAGDWAFERGHFAQTLTSKTAGEEDKDEGMFLWIYRRDQESWKVARIAGTFVRATNAEDENDGGSPGGCS